MVAQKYMSFLALSMSSAFRTVAASRSDQDHINDMLKRKDELIAEVDERSKKAIAKELSGGEKNISGLIKQFTGNNPFEDCIAAYERAMDPFSSLYWGCMDADDRKRERAYRRSKAKEALLQWSECEYCGFFHNVNDVCKERRKDDGFMQTLQEYRMHLVNIRTIEKDIVEKGCKDCNYHTSEDRKEKEAEIGKIEEQMANILKELHFEKTNAAIVELSKNVEKQDQQAMTKEDVKQYKANIEYIKKQRAIKYSQWRWKGRQEMFENLLAGIEQETMVKSSIDQNKSHQRRNSGTAGTRKKERKSSPQYDKNHRNELEKVRDTKFSKFACGVTDHSSKISTESVDEDLLQCSSEPFEEVEHSSDDSMAQID